VKPAAGYRPLAYSSPEAVQTTGTVADVLKALETERITLRHRQVLSQLLAEIKKFVNDSLWVKAASGRPRQSLNTRALTDKEAELFRTVIAKSYKEQLACECEALDCGLPVAVSNQR